MGVCQASLSDGSRCNAPGTDVDHIRPGNDHSMTNLQLLCSWCHRQKTQAEATAARVAQRPYRPAPTGPGTRREAIPDVW
ncbi:HNH endonuclease signature motif containing protein [Streptomyces parvus]|uniref:HNH endonuclease signature motif containing protein n=1 Tax=Streptomyces parvus TaxID=66428 RepID=UPI0033D479E9